jgi:hypothetical protein
VPKGGHLIMIKHALLFLVTLNKLFSKDDVVESGGVGTGEEQPESTDGVKGKYPKTKDKVVEPRKPSNTKSNAPVSSGNDFVVVKRGKISTPADLGKAGDGAVVPSGIAAVKVGSFGGNDNVLTDNASVSRQSGPVRRGSRFDKKQDQPARTINTVVPQLADTKIRTAKYLNESKDAVQGYRGRKSNKNMVRQKVTGSHMADVNYERSVDIIMKDKIYFAAGQQINSRILGTEAYNEEYPDQLINALGALADTEMYKGNYLNDELIVTIGSDGSIVDFYVQNTNQIDSVLNVNELARGAQHAITDPRAAEIDRQRIESESGDESMDNWSPMSIGIHEPTRTLSLMRDILLSTGSEVYMAARKGGQALAFQINKASLDGNHTVRPAREMILQPLWYFDSSAEYATGGSFDAGLADILSNYALNRSGSIGTLIAMGDSTQKYRNKADLMIFPNSFKKYYEIGLGYLDSFHIKPEFAKIVSKFETFSTVDGQYDPLLPVYMTDKAAIIHPVDFDVFMHIEDDVEEATPFYYQYAETRRTYRNQITHPLLVGLYNWFTENATSVYRAIRSSQADTTDRTISIPMVHGGFAPTLWSFIIMAAVPYIVKEQIRMYTDVLNYEQKTGKKYFSQLQSLKEFSPFSSSNYTFSDHNNPLKIGAFSDVLKIDWLIGEHFDLMAEDADGTSKNYMFRLPWYFNEEEFEIAGTSINISADVAAMSFPSLRAGIIPEILDFWTNYDERSIRLSMDMMVKPPYYNFQNRESGDAVSPRLGMADYKIFKHSADTDGVPVIGYDLTDLSVYAYLATPRALGWVMDAPAGLLTPTRSASGALATDMTSIERTVGALTANYKALTDPYFGETSVRVMAYRINCPIEDIGSSNNLISDYQANFQQDWNAWEQIAGYATLMTLPPAQLGIFLSYSDIIARDGDDPLLEEGLGTTDYMYSAAGVISTDTNYTRGTFNLVNWWRIQRFDWLFNPFDSLARNIVIGQDEAIPADPYDFAYLFGFADFLASDFTEDIYNRIAKKDAEQLQYTLDLFAADSPLLK